MSQSTRGDQPLPDPKASSHYPIPSSGADEIRRLNVQHGMFISSQGYYLHPEIKVPETGLRIAELACGTAIWISEFARLNPTADCHGVDITNGFFPPDEDLPANLKLHLHDIKVPWIPQWVIGCFDVVHIRMVSPAMNLDDWAKVLQNATRLLKPGGWLQWVENDAGSGVYRPLRPAAPKGASQATHGKSDWRPAGMSAFKRMCQMVFSAEKVEMMNHGYLHLEALFADPKIGGLVNVQSYAFLVNRGNDEAARREFGLSQIDSCRWYFDKEKQAGRELMDVTYEEWAKAAIEDIGNGASVIFRGTVLIGMKQRD